MGKCKDLSYFDKKQIVIAIDDWVRASPNLQLFWGCSWYSVISTHKKWSMKGQPKNQR